MKASNPKERKLNILNFLIVTLIAGLDLVGIYAALFFKGPDSGSAWKASMN